MRQSARNEVGHDAAREVVGKQLLDPVDERRPEDRGGVPRDRATRVCGQEFSYHAEDARDRARVRERPERTDPGLCGGRERGNSIGSLPHWCEYCDEWASLGW